MCEKPCTFLEQAVLQITKVETEASERMDVLEARIRKLELEKEKKQTLTKEK